MTTMELAIRVGLALLLGALIGAERQWRQRNAGLRTNTLVSVGSALFVTMSFLIEGELSPTRIAAQVVSGIGFLGAGVILREGLNVRGLNTAATLWCSAAVGVLAGAGQLTAAVIGCGAVLAANFCLRPLAFRLNRRGPQPDDAEENCLYQLKVWCQGDDEVHVRGLILDAGRANGLLPHAMIRLQGTRPGRVRIAADFPAIGQQADCWDKIVTRLTLQPPILGIRWRCQANGRGEHR